MRSESPVPRRSKTIRRENDAIRSRNALYGGHHWFCSTCDM